MNADPSAAAPPTLYRKARKWWGLKLVALVGCLWGMVSPPKQTFPWSVVYVGVAFPLTGSEVAAANAVVTGMRRAASDWNRRAGGPTPYLALWVCDAARPCTRLGPEPWAVDWVLTNARIGSASGSDFESLQVFVHPALDEPGWWLLEPAASRGSREVRAPASPLAAEEFGYQALTAFGEALSHARRWKEPLSKVFLAPDCAPVAIEATAAPEYAPDRAGSTDPVAPPLLCHPTRAELGGVRVSLVGGWTS